MASLHDLEKAAMTHGSRDAATFEAVTKMDTTLAGFFDKLSEQWPTLSSPGDKLYVLITTDHGRSDAEKVINFAHLMGPLAEHVDFTADQGVANIWFKEPPAGTTLEASPRSMMKSSGPGFTGSPMRGASILPPSLLAVADPSSEIVSLS